MDLYEVMEMVRETAKPFRNGSIITDENREQAVRELEDFTFAFKMAKRRDASGFDITEAVAGRVSKYLKGR